ncbi:MAG: hypothetical protein ACI32E_06125 [Bacilli bacterium]
MNKKIIISIILFFGGIIGAGLFAIANSIERLSVDPSIMCGIILFLFLGMFIAGLILLINELVQKKDK